MRWDSPLSGSQTEQPGVLTTAASQLFAWQHGSKVNNRMKLIPKQLLGIIIVSWVDRLDWSTLKVSFFETLYQIQNQHFQSSLTVLSAPLCHPTELHFTSQKQGYSCSFTQDLSRIWGALLNGCVSYGIRTNVNKWFHCVKVLKYQEQKMHSQMSRNWTEWFLSAVSYGALPRL